MNYTLDGSGRTLVFIHGLSDNLTYWEFLTSKLSCDYQVLRVDLQGHGQSELIDDKITVDTYVNDLNELLKDLEISKVNLIGFSLGGAVAIDFAAKYPYKVESMLLMSSFYRADDKLTDVLNIFKKSLTIGFEEFFNVVLPMTLCSDVIEANLDELEFLKGEALKNANVEAYLKAVDACLNFNAENDLSKINTPTLILAGRYDEISTLNMQKDLADRIENSNLIVFDNVKHNLLVGDNNKRVLNIMRNFFTK